MAEMQAYQPPPWLNWPDWAVGEAALGVTKHYRKAKWTALDTVKVYVSIDDFLTRRQALHPEEDPLDVVAVLMNRAASYEGR